MVVATIGVMITASHNPEEDNGVKVVDRLGEMLEASWEVYATTLANSPTASLAQHIRAIARDAHINLDAPANIVVGRDTRPSGPALLAALCAGLDAMGAAVRGRKTCRPLSHQVPCCRAHRPRVGFDVQIWAL